MGTIMQFAEPAVHPADFYPRLCALKIKWPPALVTELKALAVEEARLEAQVTVIDEHLRKLTEERDAAQQRVHVGSASVSDLDRIAEYNGDELKEKFARPKRDLEAEREQFQAAKVRPVLNQIVARFNEAVNSDRSAVEAEIESIYKRYGVPFDPAGHVIFRSIERYRDITAGNLLGPYAGAYNGVAAVRKHLGEAFPKI